MLFQAFMTRECEKGPFGYAGCYRFTLACYELYPTQRVSLLFYITSTVEWTNKVCQRFFWRNRLIGHSFISDIIIFRGNVTGLTIMMHQRL